MAVSNLAERISTSFAAWECRGRGWQLADYPVSLEPPYRPFFLLPSPQQGIRQIDDGRRPTLLSSLFERARDALTGTPASAATKIPLYEEEPPYPVYARDSLVARHILIPADLDLRPDTIRQLLSALTAGMYPVSFELVGHAGKVALQLVAREADAERVFAHISGYLPEVTLVEDGDLLADAWIDDADKLIVDFGYDEEFILSCAGLRSIGTDPYIALVAALAHARTGESLCFQVLFESPRNPWRKAIMDAVTAPDGSALFEDAPEFIPQAHEKTGYPLYACVVRLAAHAGTRERVLDLIRGTGAFFAQLARPDGNRLIPLTNDEYPDTFHEQAFLLRESYRTGMIMSADELMTLVHVPDATVRHEALVRDERRSKALPTSARGKDFVFGENVHRGQRELVGLDVPDRLAHTMIVGASGTGKSTLLVNMIRQDLERGDGLLVLDPHGDLIDDVLARVPESRMDDVIVFDPSDEAWPVGFNVLDAASERERILLASDLTGIFQRLSTSWGDTMGTVLSNAVLAMLESPDGGTLLHLRRFLVDEVYRQAFLKTISDEEVLFFWRKEWPLIGSRSIGPILTRLNTFLRPKLIRQIVGQRRPRYRLPEVIEGRKVFLAKLSQGLIGNENAYLLGSLVLSRFLQLALARQGVAKEGRKPFWIYLDEAEHFVTPSVASLLTEARKYGVGLHLAFQMLSQLRTLPAVEHAVLGNAQTRIAFRVGDDDARKLADGLSFFDATDLRNLGRGEAIARFGEARNDFNLRTFRAPPLTEDAAAARRSAVLERSRVHFAAEASALASELAELRQDFDRAPASPEPPAPPPPAAPEIRTEPTPASSPPAPPRARRPEPVEPKPLGRGGAEHKYLQHLISRLAEERGFRAVIEEPVEGGQVDVALRRADLSIACEVSITTDAGHELENLRKCLGAGFSQIWIVTTDKKRRDKLAAAVSELGATAPVTCLRTDDLVAAFEALTPAPVTTERVVGGFKVKATRRVTSYEDYEKRQSAIAAVIARSLVKGKKKD